MPGVGWALGFQKEKSPTWALSSTIYHLARREVLNAKGKEILSMVVGEGGGCSGSPGQGIHLSLGLREDLCRMQVTQVRLWGVEEKRGGHQGCHRIWYGLQAKNNFHLFMCLKKTKRTMFPDTSKLYEIQISVSIKKLYWNSATLVHLCVVSSCFQATLAASSSYNKDHLAHKADNIYYPALCRKFTNRCLREPRRKWCEMNPL